MTTARALEKKALWRGIKREERKKARAKLHGFRGQLRTTASGGTRTTRGSQRSARARRRFGDS